MLSFTSSCAMHLLTTSLKLFGPVRQVIQLALPQYRNMASTKTKINYNTRHLKKGDPLPPFNGTLRIYNMRYCPYAHRTILALNAKQINYEVVNINLVDKPEWITSKSIFGKVPAIEIKDGVTICESLVTSEYLDEAYPQRPLLPKDPLRRAYDKIIVESIGPITAAFYRSIRETEPPTDEQISTYHKALEFIQNELKSRGTKYFGGDEPGYADYMIWPWFERILVVGEPSLSLDPVRFKFLTTYLNNMMVDPAVASYVVSGDVVKKVLEGYKSGNTPNYDILLDE